MPGTNVIARELTVVVPSAGLEDGGDGLGQLIHPAANGRPPDDGCADGRAEPGVLAVRCQVLVPLAGPGSPEPALAVIASGGVSCPAEGAIAPIAFQRPGVPARNSPNRKPGEHHANRHLRTLPGKAARGAPADPMSYQVIFAVDPP